jgi:hypothetical protein
MSAPRPLTSGQKAALLHYAERGAGPMSDALLPSSITTLVQLGYLRERRETREYAITEAGRVVANRLIQENG